MTGICLRCGNLIDSREVVESGHVFIEKTCPEHGTSRELVCTSDEYWSWSMKYDRPGSKPFKWSSSTENGCPSDCGICSAHRQHTCIAIIEITGMCDLACNVCFADAPSAGHLPFDTITSMIDTYVSYETHPEILQLSGGEPTLHPDLFSIVKYAKKLGIGDVAVSTNGLRLLDEDFAKEFAKTDPVVYLQFDTFKPEVSKLIRGRDLTEEKQHIVSICNELGMTTVLVPTIIAGLNEDEIGRLIEYGFSQKKVFSVNFQPISLTGRIGIPEVRSLTVVEILEKIEQQTDGVLELDDFRPIPCPHPHCTAICYLLADENGIVPLTDIVDVDDYIDYAKDRTLVSESVLMDEAFRSLFSTSAVPGTEKNLDAFCNACGISVPEILSKSVKTVGVHAFMGANNYQLERAQKCCIHVIQPDGKMIPFCNFNMFHRHKGGCR